MAKLGFAALATTSAGYAFSVGQLDNTVGRDDMLRHVAAIAAATDLPVSGDLTNGFGDEPATVAESEVEQYACTSRTGVVLRFGLVVGDDAMTRWQLRAAAQGRPFGVGDPDGWLHPVHSEDIGSAVVASLGAPSGIYNVGAEPVRRSEYVATLAAAAGRREGTFLTPLRRRLAGGRAEPLARSLRVSSERFTATTGWSPQRRVLDRGWFDVGSAVLR